MKSFFFVGLIVLFTLCGCAHSKKIKQPLPAKNSVFMQTAEEIIGSVFATFRTYESAAFERIVSPDFTPDRLLFLGIVDSGFSSGTVLDLQYSIIQATPKDKTLTVVFTWKKIKIPYNQDNTPITQKGKAEFIFENNTGKWLLAEVKGDSPF